MARRARISGPRRAEQHERTRLCAWGDHASPERRGPHPLESMTKAGRSRYVLPLCLRRCASIEWIWIWAACFRPRPAHHPEQRRARARSRPRPARPRPRPRYTRPLLVPIRPSSSPSAALPRCAYCPCHPSIRASPGAGRMLRARPAPTRRAQRHSEDTRSLRCFPPTTPLAVHAHAACAHSCPRPACVWRGVWCGAGHRERSGPG
ncbi:hypothetical protein C8R44DRAFT_437825 [Mycena epipterygia]|nr:hypothetical protein C8R44DRAFT_437825 [Mycena epipterygia]